MSFFATTTTLEEAPTVGIDLGTTYSCISVYQNGECIVIPVDNQNTMASCVSFGEDGRLIGNKAKEDSILNPTNTIIDVKRYIGCRFDSNELQNDIGRYLYEVFDENGNPKIKVNNNNQEIIFAPEEISSMILGKLKQSAEEYFEKVVCKAVITVPAHFKDSQRQATIDAGRIAGLDARRIINEPTAAALAFRVKEKYESDTEERNILVYDFGGGTFDVSIVTLDSGVLDVKATNGDTHLGGNDIDECLVEYFKKKFEEENNMSLDDNPRALRRLRMQCEKVKKDLSDKENATIDLDELLNNVGFYYGITRKEFENLCRKKIEQTLALVAQALTGADLNKTEIDDILLIGGSTRIPLVRKLLKDFFNGKELNTSLDPDLAVSMGAAIQAAVLDGDENQTTGTLLLLDVTPLSLGIETAGGLMTTLIPRNSPVPAKVTKKFSNEKDYQLKVKISVYEGERTLVEDNNKLGEFLMSGITPRIRGKTHINVSFEVNTDGILHMIAEELAEELTEGGTNNIVSVAVDKGRLSESEITRMISTALRLQKEDEQKKIIIQAKIALESYCIDTKHKAKKVVSNREDCNTILHRCDEVLEWIKEERAQSKEMYEKKRSEVNGFIRPILIKYL